MCVVYVQNSYFFNVLYQKYISYCLLEIFSIKAKLLFYLSINIIYIICILHLFIEIHYLYICINNYQSICPSIYLSIYLSRLFYIGMIFKKLPIGKYFLQIPTIILFILYVV